MVGDISLAITFLIYLAIVIGLGVFAWRRTHNSSDYFLGGRRLPPAVAALSAGASDMSGWLLLGLPGAAYASGLSAAWIAIGLMIGMLACWLSMARRLRIYTHALDNALTIPTYLQRRFAIQSPWLRIICASFILLFFLFYVASGLIAGGKLFHAVFGWDYQWAVVIGALAIISYTLFGGFLAVSWTDVFQGLLMCLALLAVPIMIINLQGGWQTTEVMLQQDATKYLSLFTDAAGTPLTLLGIISAMAWGLGYFGQPHILARFKALRAPEDARTATAIALIWSLLCFIGAIGVGLLGHLILSDGLADGEQVFIATVETLFHPLIAGMLLAAILSAIMSTADSQLLVSSSALAEDIYAVWGQDASPNTKLWIGRLAVVGLALLAVAFAMDPNASVLDVVAYAWAGLGAAFGPAILLSLYWARMSGAGAVAGVVTGGITVIVWRHLSGGLFDIYELLPGFVLSVIAIALVSGITTTAAAVSDRHRQLPL
ncbi:sodium/proline symporter PutP [Maricurvus nonylphenolicus]|uniref:sodium/proline symporter PutP n=1 Tax=Maricurvus nonylphenolicus TaxID=1008307 RepID=UPI0036F28259